MTFSEGVCLQVVWIQLSIYHPMPMIHFIEVVCTDVLKPEYELLHPRVVVLCLFRKTCRTRSDK